VVEAPEASGEPLGEASDEPTSGVLEDSVVVSLVVVSPVELDVSLVSGDAALAASSWG